MGEREIFEQINDVLRENGYNTRINGLMDLTHFLNEKRDTDSLVYDKVRELYAQFMMVSVCGDFSISMANIYAKTASRLNEAVFVLEFDISIAALCHLL